LTIFNEFPNLKCCFFQVVLLKILLLAMAKSTKGNLNYHATLHHPSAMSYSSMSGPSSHQFIVHPRADATPQTTAIWNPSPLLKPWIRYPDLTHHAPPSAPVLKHHVVVSQPYPHVVVHHHHHILHQQERKKLAKPAKSLIVQTPQPVIVKSTTVKPLTTTALTTSSSTTTTTTTTSTTPRPATTTTTTTARVQVERKSLVVEEEEEGSGDGPLSENGKGWEGKGDELSREDSSLEFDHDFRDFHLGY
jgi:hypothetical protein